jgi:hypothetical protein
MRRFNFKLKFQTQESDGPCKLNWHLMEQSSIIPNHSIVFPAQYRILNWHKLRLKIAHLNSITARWFMSFEYFESSKFNWKRFNATIYFKTHLSNYSFTYLLVFFKCSWKIYLRIFILGSLIFEIYGNLWIQILEFQG